MATIQIDTSFSNLFVTNVLPSQGDRDYITSSPEAIARLHFGESVPELSFTKDNIEHFYPAQEGVAGGANVHDLVSATDAVITGYTETCRTYFQNTNFGLSNVLLTQDSGGVATGIVPNNTVDYVNSGGEYVENLLLYSEDFTDGYFATDYASIIAEGVDPNGGSNSFKITESAANNRHIMQAATTATVTGYENYISAYVKAGSGNRYVFLRIAQSNGYGIMFDLTNGVITDEYLYGTGSIYSTKVEDAGNGWYRITVYGDRVDGIPYFVIGMSDRDTYSGIITNGDVHYSGDGTSYIYATMGSISTFESEYVETTDTVVNTYIADNSGAEIHTNFKPNLNNMTIFESVSGMLEDLDANGVSLGTQSQRDELRVWKTDGTYKINDTLQGYSPPAPDRAVKMVLSDTASIGYSDPVDRTTCLFGVITEVTTDLEDTQIYNDYLACNPTLMTSEGLVLTTDDGIPLTKD